jgi:hypothetical protein
MLSGKPGCFVARLLAPPPPIGMAFERNKGTVTRDGGLEEPIEQ